jgi:hypothetical protein
LPDAVAEAVHAHLLPTRPQLRATVRAELEGVDLVDDLLRDRRHAAEQEDDG